MNLSSPLIDSDVNHGVGVNHVDDADDDQNQSEWLVLENFVRSLVEDWRYQARVGPVAYGLLVCYHPNQPRVPKLKNVVERNILNILYGSNTYSNPPFFKDSVSTVS